MGRVVLSFLVVVAVLAASAACQELYSTMTGFAGDEYVDEVQHIPARPTYDETQFKGKVVLVTGGSSGIGFATALTLARFGAHVIICSRDFRPDWFTGMWPFSFFSSPFLAFSFHFFLLRLCLTGAQAVEKIMKDNVVVANGGKVRWVKADVSNKESVAQLFKNIREREGTLDFAVNNAGIVGAAGPLNTTVQYFGTQYDPVHINVYGTVNCLEYELQLFTQQEKNAAIVNLASVNGYRSAGLAPLYSASKHAIIGITRSVASEYAQDTPTVRINALAPGFTNTSLVWQQAKLFEDGSQVWEGDYITPNHPLWKKWGPEFVAMTPNHRMADPMDQANMIAFLLARESALITGNVFVVDDMVGEE